MTQFPPDIQVEITGAYTDALKITWVVATAICGFAAVFALFEVDIPLRASLRTEFGIKEKSPSEPIDQEANRSRADE